MSDFAIEFSESLTVSGNCDEITAAIHARQGSSSAGKPALLNESLKLDTDEGCRLAHFLASA